MDKKEAAEKMMTPEENEGILELRKAVQMYNLEPDDRTYRKVLSAFFTAARDAKAAYCPVASFDFENNGFTPGKAVTADGSCYVICTSPEEAALCPEESVVVIGMDIIVAHVAGDPSCIGICLNPYGGRPCFFPMDYIRRILGME